MKIKWSNIILAGLLVLFTACEDTKDDEFNPEMLYSGDMTASAQLLDIESGDYVSTWDIAMVYENSSYLVKLNSASHIVAVQGDTSFEAAELPVAGFASDGDGSFVIGSNWQDPTTYNFSDNHSITTNGNTWFVLTSNLDWVKLEVLYGSTVMMKIRYSFEGSDVVDTLSVDYEEDIPVYYNFAGTAEVTPSDWDLGFTSVPVYAGPQMGIIMMPSVIFNEGSGVEMAIVTGEDYEDIDGVSGATWHTDDAIIGYEGDQEILNYHGDIHQVLIDNSDTHTYVFNTGDAHYKIKFLEYADGVITFYLAGI